MEEIGGQVERAAGIEPACLTWKDSALPLSYARISRQSKTHFRALLQDFFCVISK
ncbi:MAG: hypothetical protein RLZZ214_1602 [Verrucomicrobiota bacterium]